MKLTTSLIKAFAGFKDKMSTDLELAYWSYFDFPEIHASEPMEVDSMNPPE